MRKDWIIVPMECLLLLVITDFYGFYQTLYKIPPLSAKFTQ